MGACVQDGQIKEDGRRVHETAADSLQIVRARVRAALRNSGDLEKEGQRLLSGGRETNAQAAARLADEAQRVSRDYRTQARARRDATLVPEVVDIDQQVQRLRSVMREDGYKSDAEKIQAIQTSLIESQLSAHKVTVQQQQKGLGKKKEAQRKYP